jgi:hypothetical protein
MATFNHINLEETSTVTAKVATIQLTRNSSAHQQEIFSLGDPELAGSIARISSVAPASSDAGLIVRQVGYVAPSTTISIAAMPAGSTTVSVANNVLTNGDSTVFQGTNPWLVQVTAPLSSAVAAANSSALNVRIVGGVSSAVDFPVSVLGYSTIVSVAALPANSSQVQVTALPANSSQVEVRNTVTIQGNSSVLQSGTWTVNLGTNLQSSVAPSSGSSGLMTREIYDARLVASSTNVFTSTSFVIQSSGAGLATYVTAYSIMTTNAGPTQVAFYTSGTMVWPMVFAAISSAVSGANLSGSPYLFKSAVNEAMTLQMNGSTIAGWVAAVSYYRAP